MPELIKNYIKTNRLIPTEKMSLVFNSDFTIPDNMPEISSILSCDAAVTIDKIQTETDRATAELTINYTVLYMPQEENPEIKSLCLKNQQTVIINAPGADSDCICTVSFTVEQTEITGSTTRKISFKSTVSCMPHIENVTEITVPIGIEGIPDIQTAEIPYTLSTAAENVTDVLDITEKAELPLGKSAFKCLLKNDAAISDISFTVAANELTVKGNLNICTLYIADDPSKALQVIENQIPFTETIFVENDSDSIIWNVSAILNSFSAEATEDSDGELRVLNITAAIKIDAHAYETVTGTMLSDAYSLSQVFSLPSQKLSVYSKCGELSSQFVMKTIASVPEGMPEISEIVSVKGQIGQLDISPEESGAVIDGTVICSVLYISKDDEKPVSSFLSPIPFTQRIDGRSITENSVISMQLAVNHTSFSILSPSEIEMRISITAQGEILTPGAMNLIEDLTDISDYNPDRENQPSILIYVVQPGDTLWKIAKRYNAPIEILKSINDIENADIIIPGQKLFIPKG